MGAAHSVIAVRRAHSLAILALVAVPAWRCGAQTPPAARAASAVELPRLPPRAAIAGIETLETTSSITFAARPGVRHELVATFAFPARGRLQLSAQRDRATVRTLRYRYGDVLLSVESGESASRELTGGARDEVLGELELRRATFLWPDGFDWTTSASSRAANVDGVGSLRAQLGDGRKQPDAIDLVDPQGKSLLAFRAIQWIEQNGRTWPTAFEVWRGSEQLASESVVGRELTKTYIDSFFLPADRRDRSTEHDAMLGVARSQELPKFCARRVDLTPGRSWNDARAEVERVRSEWSAKLQQHGLALDASWTVEIDESARPKSLLVRLATTPEAVPEGFVTTAVRQARVMFVANLDAVTAERLAELRRAAPAGASLQTPYLRFRPQDGQVLLVLPFAP